MVTKAKQKIVLSDRVRRLKEALLLQTRPKLSLERLRFLKDSYEETEGEPLVLRRAKFFDKFLRGMSISIDENPIVGSVTQYLYGATVYPEFSADWLKNEPDIATYLGRELTEEDRELLHEATDYWENKCVQFRANELCSQKCGAGYWDDLRDSGVAGTSVNEGRPQRLCLDYGKVLNEGLNGIVDEARAELNKLSISLETLPAWDFLNAVIIACNGAIALAQRYASLAREMAEKEANPQRRKELERIADTCEWVPANPARNFYEAIQSFWFAHVITLIEYCSIGLSPGRFPRYMYPFYKKDKEEGRITEEEATELLELLFLKHSAVAVYAGRPRQELGASGSMFQNMSLGGVDEYGDHATNELDFLLLEAQERIQLPQPTFSVIYHNKMSPEFLMKCAQLVRTGIGMPAFFNNDLNIQRLYGYGSSLEDARTQAIIGCVVIGWSGCGATLFGGMLNIPKMLEITLNNGRDPLTGKQVGPETGKAEAFDSYEALESALRQQIQYLMRVTREAHNIGGGLIVELAPMPFASALINDCIKKGKELNSGGARYNQNGNSIVGMINLADSLAAIKKLVFEEKRLTMSELLDALRVDFEGTEDVRQMLLQAPKYGNDNDYVDRIVQNWYAIIYEEHQKYHDYLGKIMKPHGTSVVIHIVCGALTGALPSGRKAKEPFADGSVSASQGADENGPTSLLKSAAKAMDVTKYGASLLNMKFHPLVLKDAEGLRKLMALVKTYFDLGGHHIQFNVVSAETLRDAQVHPENYKSLVVRVAGFSAFFVRLDPVVQNEIIQRSELTLS